jgi:soluble lytic murein transglycosylase-like protein
MAATEGAPVIAHAHAAYSVARACVLLLAVTWARPGVACWEEAAQQYQVHPYLLYAIAKTESGLNPAAINRNKNGTYDIGLMQINSRWLPTLRRYGVDEKQLFEPCTNIRVGAWILAQNMRRMGNTWDAIGAYNSSKPALQLKYVLRVYRNIPPGVLAAGSAR